MEAFIVNCKSWHYRIAVHWDARYRLTEGYTFSVCEYWRTVVTATFMLGILAIGGTALVGMYLFGMYVGLSHLLWGAVWSTSDMGLALAMAVVTVVMLIVAAFFIIQLKFQEYAWRKWRERQNPNYKPKPAGRLIQAYRHWKDRVCVPVEFHD